MARRRIPRATRERRVVDQSVSANGDDLLLAALEGGGEAEKTGRFLVTLKEGAMDKGLTETQARKGLRVAHARDFKSCGIGSWEAPGGRCLSLADYFRGWRSTAAGGG